MTYPILVHIREVLLALLSIISFSFLSRIATLLYSFFVPLNYVQIHDAI